MSVMIIHPHCNSIGTLLKTPSLPAGKPVLESLAPNGSLTVVWSKPTRVGRSPLRGYQVEYFLHQPLAATEPAAAAAHHHHWSIAEVQEERYSLAAGLPTGATVVFLVRARNEHGLSPPSLLSERLTIGEGGGGEDETEEERAEVKKRLTSKLVEWLPMEAASPTEVILHWTVRWLTICIHSSRNC